MSFAEIERGVYRGYLAVSEPGLYTTLGALHAVNAPQEYYDLGMSPSLLSAVAATEGVVFDSAEVGEMIEVFRRQSFRDVIERRSVTGVFVGAVLALLLLEILLRRLWQYKNL